MLKAKKQLGQNFLIDNKVTKKMVKTLDIRQKDFLIEIGPGQGVVTSEILTYDFKQLIAVELDQDMIKVLEKKFFREISMNKLILKHENVLDFLPLLGSKKIEHSLKIIGSLPYYITSPIIHKLLYMQNGAQKIVVLIQKEVAEKITSNAPNNNYMATIINTFYEAKFVEEVPREAFEPIPNVDSAIVELSKKAGSEIEMEQIRKYEGFLHKAYSNPRKMLNKVFTPEELAYFKISASARPQEIPTNTWIKAFKGTL